MKKSNPLEAYIERKIVDYAKKRNVYSIKLNLQGRRNEPDRLFFIPGGRPLFIEVKREGEEPRPGQRKRIQELHLLGYYVVWVDSVADGAWHIDNALKGTK